MNLPSFITFTGADDQTDIAGMIALSCDYPIEWGILFSPKRHGTPRYPTLEWVERLVSAWGFNLSVHLCGGYTRSLLSQLPHTLHGFIQWTGDDRHDCLVSALLTKFNRVQINTAQPAIDTLLISGWARSWGLKPILQTRSDVLFPSDGNVSWLFDRSGGEGVSATRYPAPAYPADQQRVGEYGYAGGINPENVGSVLERIPNYTRDYWIDMESGVRTDERFDLAKCRAVCEAVYGAPKPKERFPEWKGAAESEARQ